MSVDCKKQIEKCVSVEALSKSWRNMGLPVNACQGRRLGCRRMEERQSVRKIWGVAVGSDGRSRGRCTYQRWLVLSCACLSSDCCLVDSNCTGQTRVLDARFSRINSLHPLLHNTGIVVVLIIILPVLLHVVRIERL